MSDIPHKPTFEELQNRILDDVIEDYTGATLEQVALVWHGYLRALYEWEIITLLDYDQLTALLPCIQDNPVRRIFSGWSPKDEEE
jgi:hypothetical protein